MLKGIRTYGAISLVASSLIAQSIGLDTVEVTAAADPDGAGTKVISGDTIQNRVAGGETNPYKALDLEPSVHTGQADAYGLSLDQNSFRVRGLYADTFSRLAQLVDGVPSVVNVGQGAMGSILDLENIENMTFTAGPSNADTGFGFGNDTGTLDMTVKKASNHFDSFVKQTFGEEDFSRTFARIDTGKLPYDVRMFISASRSSVDKWRGTGDSKRDNVEVGITVPFSNNFKMDLFWAHNDIERNDYLPLNYAQTLDLKKNYNLDFNPTITGTAATDKYYYDFNRQHFRENLIQGNFELKTGGGLLTFKPYRIDTNGYRYSYNTSGSTINKAEMEQEQTGFVARYDRSFSWIDASMGYWFQTIDTLPPPTAQKSYAINNGGLAFNGWSMLNDVGSRKFYSPFMTLHKQFDTFDVKAGVRYLEMKLPSIQGYTTTTGDVSYEEAMRSATLDPDMYVNPVTFKKVLPSINMKYTLNSNIDLLADYARGYASPWNGPLFSIYKSKKAVFASHGITLQDLWNTLKLEMADTYDIGARIRGENWRIEPTLYYTRYTDKQVTAFDPVTGLNYYQSNAQAEGKGVELSLYYRLVDELELFGSLSYNQLNFIQDLTTTGGALLSVKGNQVPDAPKRLAKIGATLRHGGFYVTPALRYVDSRYGDIQNTQELSSYTTVDIEGGYIVRNVAGFKEVAASIAVQNLLNRRYIAIIKNDLDDTGTNGAYYYQGAPSTAMITVSARF